MARLIRGLVRAPDVGFFSWARLPGRKVPKEAIAPVPPDLAIEVLSKGNTRKEMTRKRREYFKAGVLRVWQVDPRKRQVVVYSSPTESELLGDGDTLRGEPVLPGLEISVTALFDELEEEG